MKKFFFFLVCATACIAQTIPPPREATPAEVAAGTSGATYISPRRLGTAIAEAGDSYAKKDQNLGDLSNAAAARSNLGLGDAATRAVGTGAGTVAAGDDTRIANAVQASTLSGYFGSPSSYGSFNAANWRSGLGLGSLALLSGPLTPPDGGTGLTSAAVDAIITGNGTSAMQSSGVLAYSRYTVVALGDSITQTGGWTNQLNTLLGSSWYVFNQGISGNNSAQSLLRSAQAIQASNASHVVIAIGINDIVQGVSSSTIISNVNAIVALCTGKIVLVCTIPPFGSNVDWTSGKQAQLEAFNTALLSGSIAGVTAVNTFDVLTGGSGINLKPEFNTDGLHPNAAGNVAIGNAVYAALGTWTPGVLNPRIAFGGSATDLFYRFGVGKFGLGGSLFIDSTDDATTIGNGSLWTRGGASLGKSLIIGGNFTFGGSLIGGNGTNSSGVSSGTFQVNGGGSFTLNLYAGGLGNFGGSLTSGGTITGGDFVSNSTSGIMTATVATTNPKYFRWLNTGGGGYLGSEGSVGGGFFTGSNAYETVLFSPGNAVYFRTPTLRLSTDLSVLNNAAVGGTLSVTGSATVGGTITAPSYVSTTSSGGFTNTSSSTSYKFLRLGNDGSSLYTGIESSVGGGFFTGSSAYEAIWYAPSNATYFRTPNVRFSNTLQPQAATSITTSSAGQFAFDTDAWAASRGAMQVHDGTANTYVVAALASDNPTNGQSPMWNTGGTITWETRSAAAVSSYRTGTATLVAGTVTVSDAATTANTRFRPPAVVTPGGTPGALYVSAKSNGVSFTITSTSNTDTSTVYYEAFEP